METIGRKWVFKRKIYLDRNIEKKKEKLALKGYSHV